ncbi:hypothetical protein GCM10020358_12350 [Amorphoplanes nipponensis]|uniref:Uncharacterized protein n=1 Tax=Actinoplanes nipponensis TaxID=135950 RepID=A0A919JH83_9ACTN|nr:hypothetical protein [Actinoplanes nipponensis]GIE50728.1 hypothetical protein Ani05nite_42620 [Actinoplanes nipponensis]
MTERRYRYSVGNEHDPGDPWGRSELVIEPDGVTRLDHHFPVSPGPRSWTGRIPPAAVRALWRGLEQAGFPAGPASPPPAGSALRRLTVETPRGAVGVVLPWNLAASAEGYAAVADLIDGVISQLTGGAVDHPSTRPAVVSDIVAVR